MIQESTEFWPSKEGLNSENSNLLSNIVYDVAFDNNNGLASLVGTSNDTHYNMLQDNNLDFFRSNR